MPPPEGGAPAEPSAAGDRSTGPQGFRPLGERTRHEGWRISLVEATFAAPDGTVFTRDVVRHPGAVAVVPVTAGGAVLLVRQYRGAVDRELLEIPAGTRDVDGEAPEHTARRELEEEAGVRAGRLRLLGAIYNTPGFCDEETLIYLAEDLEPGEALRHGDEERYLEVVEVPLGEAVRLVSSGEVVDGQTVLGVLLARDVLEGRSPEVTPGAPRR